MQRIVVFVILLTLVLATACSSLVIGKKTSLPPRTKTFEDGFRRPIRTESGTPYLNKIPGVNRLFSNTAINYRFFIWDTTTAFETMRAAISRQMD